MAKPRTATSATGVGKAFMVAPRPSGGPRCPPVLLAMSLGSVAVLTAPPAGAQCQYEMRTIEPPCMFTMPAVGRGINDPGIVVGHHRPCSGSGDELAFWWDGGSQMHYLNFPPNWPFPERFALDGNSAGVIVGQVRDSSGGGPLWASGFIYDGQAFTFMGTLPGGNFSRAEAINERGDVTGTWGNNNTGPSQAFLWCEGTMIDLGPDLQAIYSSAFDINDHRAIVGWRLVEPGRDRIGFLWRDGEVIDLGPAPIGFRSEPWAINNNGVVVGSLISQSVIHGFIWHDGTMTILSVPDAERTFATDINDLGQVVGYCSGCPDSSGFIVQNGVMTLLGDLVQPGSRPLRSVRVPRINEAGQITGSAEGDALLLTPVGRPPTDLNIDCRTDEYDLLIIVESWGPGSPPADLNRDGRVDVLDLLMLLANWG